MPSTSLFPADPPLTMTDFREIAQRARSLGSSLTLEGVDMGPAGLDEAALQKLKWIRELGDSVSFCLNDITYTVFEDPEDGYRSSMGSLVERPGNHCKNRFCSIPVTARFKDTYERGAPDLDPSEIAKSASAPDLMTLRVSLLADKTKDVLSVGTDHSDDYYPCFISYFSAEGLSEAFCAHEGRALDATLAPGEALPRAAPRV